jgi:acetyl esterase/lipase
MSDTSIRVLKDIAYKTPDTPDIAPSSNTLDLYLPAVSANPSTTPLLVYIHGGLWLDRDKREYAQLASAFAAKNMAVAVINYRLSLDTITATRVHPAHTKDCADAIKWSVSCTLSKASL